MVHCWGAEMMPTWGFRDPGSPLGADAKSPVSRSNPLTFSGYYNERVCLKTLLARTFYSHTPPVPPTRPWYLVISKNKVQ